MLPADGHVHSEWSWDAVHGSMERSCRRAVESGLPSIAFTEHADITARNISSAVELPTWQHELVSEGMLRPPTLDVDNYLNCVRDCRRQFPDLRILTGVELGEPHRHQPHIAGLLGAGRFDRVLASVHVLPGSGAGFETLDTFYRIASPDQVVRAYLREVLRLVDEFDGFDVLAHIDYALRWWPRQADRLPTADFAEEYRAVLAALAVRGKALEVNTRLPLAIEIVRWWHELGGETITFGSDAHRPEDVARGFRQAGALAEATGFAPPRDPHGLWRRR